MVGPELVCANMIESKTAIRIFMNPRDVQLRGLGKSNFVPVLLFGVLDCKEAPDVIQVSRLLPDFQELATEKVLGELWSRFTSPEGIRFSESLFVEGYDYFASSELVEQSNFSTKTSALNLAIRLCCLELHVESRFRNFSYEFDWRVSSMVRRLFTPKSRATLVWPRRNFLLGFLRGVMFWQLVLRELLKGSLTAIGLFLSTREASHKSNTDLLPKTASALFMSYFSSGKDLKSHPATKYWGRLDEVLDEHDEKVAFCYLDARPLMQRVLDRNVYRSASAQEKPAIFFIDAIRFPKMPWIVLRRYFALARGLIYNLGSARRRMVLLGRFESLATAPLIRSTVGATAAKNIFFACQMNFVINSTFIRQVFYPMEFQGWEALLNQSIMHSPYSPVVSYGYPHTALRRGDLRFYRDRVIWGQGRTTPTPSKVLSHSPEWEGFLAFQTSNESEVISVEALRVIEIDADPSASDSSPSIVFLAGYTKEGKRSAFFLARQVARQVKTSNLERKLTIRFRAHPLARLANKERLSLIASGVVVDDLQKLRIDGGDVVFVDPQSSVALDAYLAGANVFTLLPPHQILMSPLSGLVPKLAVVGTESEAIGAIQNILSGEFPVLSINSHSRSLFRLETHHLSRWRNLLTGILDA